MASVEEAQNEHRKAEEELQAFKEDNNRGKWLDELNGKQRRRERLDEDEREKLKQLVAEKERLEGMKDYWAMQVGEWGAQLRETTQQRQPGNEFVTRALVT